VRGSAKLANQVQKPNLVVVPTDVVDGPAG